MRFYPKTNQVYLDSHQTLNNITKNEKNTETKNKFKLVCLKIIFKFKHLLKPVLEVWKKYRKYYKRFSRTY